LKSKIKNKIHKASKNENQPPPENRTRIDSNERATRAAWEPEEKALVLAASTLDTSNEHLADMGRGIRVRTELGSTTAKVPQELRWKQIACHSKLSWP
jgi:hypothetical protein